MADIWVRLDKRTGDTKEVWEGGTLSGGTAVKHYADDPKSPTYKKKKKKGDKTNHGKDIGKKDPHDKQILPVDPGSGGSDPCCYRDPGTGDEWCWC